MHSLVLSQDPWVDVGCEYATNTVGTLQIGGSFALLCLQGAESTLRAHVGMASAKAITHLGSDGAMRRTKT